MGSSGEEVNHTANNPNGARDVAPHAEHDEAADTSTMKTASQRETPNTNTTKPAPQTGTPNANTMKLAPQTGTPNANTMKLAPQSGTPNANTVRLAPQNKTPEANTTMPVQQRETPEANITKPASQSEAPEANTMMPASQSETPEANIMKPASQSETPEINTIKSASQSETPEGNIMKPASQSETPEANIMKPASQSETPEINTIKSASQMPEANATEPASQRVCQPKYGFYVVLLVATTFLHGFSSSLAYSVGTLFVDWSETFDSDKSSTAWILSLNIGLMFLTGPVSGALCWRFGDRPTAICGTLFAALGLASSGYCTNIAQLYVTYSIFSGIGYGLMQMAAMSSTGRHFDEHRTLAMGAVSFGSGSCLFVLPYMLRAVADEVTWRGTHVVLASLVMQGVVMAALLRPPQKKEAIADTGQTRESPEADRDHHWWTMFSLCLDVRLLIFSIGNVIMGFGGNTLPAVIVDYAVDIGISKADGAQLLSLIGLGGLLGRLIVMPLMMTEVIKGKAIYMYITGGLLRALGTILCPTTSSLVVLSILNVAYGVGLGMQISTGTPLLPEVFGTANMPHYFGFYYFSLGIGSVLGSPVAGWLYGTVNNYDLPLYLNGAITLSSLLFHIPVSCLQTPKTKPPPGVSAANSAGGNIISTNQIDEITSL